MTNIFICNQNNHECDNDGVSVLLLRNGLEIEDTPENYEKHKDQICGGSVTCSICGQSALSKAMWT